MPAGDYKCAIGSARAVPILNKQDIIRCSIIQHKFISVLDIFVIMDEKTKLFSKFGTFVSYFINLFDRFKIVIASVIHKIHKQLVIIN